MNEERRRAVRHSLAVRVTLPTGSGITSDMSGVGVAFETAVALQIGEEIEFTVAIPGAADLRCRGRVVRVSGEPGQLRIGATIEGYALEGEAQDRSHAIVRDLELHHPQGWEWGE